MGAGSVLQWFLFTNMLIAAVPGVLWMKRGARDNSRTGASMGLAILILVATVNTFLPCSMWVQAMPEVFDVPWFYARSEERRVGQECVRTCRSRWSPFI